MAQHELIMPKMGESIMEATILKWLKSEGDTIEADEPVLEIATDKVDSEVPSPVEGKLVKILFQEGDVVEVGKAIAIISQNGEMEAVATPEPGETTPANSAEPASKPSPVSTSPTPPTATPAGNAATEKPAGDRFYSPLVLNIARKEGISIQELEALPGSGQNERVTKKDILAYVSERPQGGPPVKERVTASPSGPAKIDAGGNVEIVEMDRMRKLIADHMVMSKHTSPHVTSFVEADVTNLVKWRNRIKNDFLHRTGERLTFTPIFIEAIAQALREFPFVNSSVDGTRIIRKKDINIGMAAALPSGNLIVPVIRNADELNLTGLAKRVNDLADRARNNKLKPDEIDGATYTVTNVGTFGNVMGTPIINQPQVAIMATGAIRKKPGVIETAEGDFIGIRHMMFLSHSYDHRIVDGAMGGSFVRRVADILEQWDINRTL